MTLTSISADICTDCLLIVANDDDSGIEDPAAHRAAMEEHAALNLGFSLVPGDGEPWFGRERCDGCGSDLAGDRHAAWWIFPA